MLTSLIILAPSTSVSLGLERLDLEDDEGLGNHDGLHFLAKFGLVCLGLELHASILIIIVIRSEEVLIVLFLVNLLSSLLLDNLFFDSSTLGSVLHLCSGHLASKAHPGEKEGVSGDIDIPC